MTCSACERVRRFFRDGAAKVAPFTEYTLVSGDRILVSNYTGEVVDGEYSHVYNGATVTVTSAPGFNDLITFEFPGGALAGVAATKARKLFSNPFRD